MAPKGYVLFQTISQMKWNGDKENPGLEVTHLLSIEQNLEPGLQTPESRSLPLGHSISVAKDSYRSP